MLKSYLSALLWFNHDNPFFSDNFIRKQLLTHFIVNLLYYSKLLHSKFKYPSIFLLKTP
jgi:hypothetical protein